MANVAILTNFQEFIPGYSLTGIVKDQVSMLARSGNSVYLYVSEKYNGETIDPAKATLCPEITDMNLIDYASIKDLTDEHLQQASFLAERLLNSFERNAIDVIFTHDWIFTGWNLPYAMAIRQMPFDRRPVPWMHWVHSIPTGNRDWWSIGDYPGVHRIVYPNRTDLQLVAEQFRGSREALRIIPHIKDIRTFFDFRGDTLKIIDSIPELMQASFIQVYPASTDRLSAKRLDMVIKMFAALKGQKHSVCLICANQWATGRQRKEDIQEYISLAERCGLEYGKEFVFTSELYNGRYEKGLPTDILRELMMLGNIFFYPTREESFGLCLPEVVLASGALCILNKSLQQQFEVSFGSALYFDFGSFDREIQHTVNPDERLAAIATVALGRFLQNESAMLRTLTRQAYNMDNIYARYYRPIMSELVSLSVQKELEAQQGAE